MNETCSIPIDFQLVSERFSSSLYFLCIINSFLAILSICENLLIVRAILSNPQLHSQSNIILLSLVLSDLITGLVVQPSWIALKLALVQNNCKVHSQVYGVWLFSFDMATAVTFVHICFITFDRFLALTLHLRYRNIVTTRRVVASLVGVWISAAIYSLWTYFNRSSSEFFMISSGMLNLALTLGCSIKIFQVLRRHRCQIQQQFHLQRNEPNVKRFLHLKKSVRTMLCILMLFFITYSPCLLYIIVRKTNAVKKSSIFVLSADFITTFLYSNSCLNPVLYCCRISGIRGAVKETIKNLFAKVSTCLFTEIKP